jgi:hypothetical protein
VKILWLLLAAACGATAVVFAFLDDFEKAFIAAAGGAVCWFLNYRQQLKEKMPKEDEHEEDFDDEESDEEVRS